MNKFFILTIILVLGAWGKVAAQDAAAASKRANPVSYTHLTLPTICSV